MPTTLVVILLVLWLMGEVTDHTFGGLLHILFLAALVLYGISLVAERRKITGHQQSERGFFSH